jgi:hypothetical protein
MPKLPAKVAKEVDSTEAAGSFAPIPPGLYAAVLKEVELKDGTNGPYWVWMFEIPEGYEYEGRRFWNNTSLSEKSRPFLKKVFDAFGVPAGTDTDELCGQWVTLRIGNRVIKEGERAGETANTVSEVLPYDEDADEDDDEE